MPELPDVSLYVEKLREVTQGRRCDAVRLKSSFLVRTHTPRLDDAVGRRLIGFRRIGKRIVFEFEGELCWVLHLMIAGRLWWRPARASLPGRAGLLAVDFEHGTLHLTEVATKKRASLYVVQGLESLREHDPGGLEPLECTLAEFEARLRLENHTLKRALTDPRLFSGIGNAYSDEILFHAGLSPLERTQSMRADSVSTLHEAVVTTLTYWTERLRAESPAPFPERVTAFREGMNVHGRYRAPCLECGTAIQRIRYASNEVDYCPRCQTGGKVLRDRSLSLLLRGDWPERIEELEALRGKIATPVENRAEGIPTPPPGVSSVSTRSRKP